MLDYHRKLLSAVGGGIILNAYDITATVALDGSYSVKSQATIPTGLTFNDDGTKVYLPDDSSDRIHQYTLTTAYDVTGTVSHDGSYNVGGQDSQPGDIAFNDDGTKFYMVGNKNARIYQYSVTTAYDLTGTVGLDGSYYVGSQEGNPGGLAFNNNGTKFYTLGSATDSIHQYTLTTAYDVTGTVSHDGSYNVGGEDTITSAVEFNDDGTKVYIAGLSTESIYQYTLNTTYDVTDTVTLDGSYYVGSEEGTPRTMAFNDDGTKLYILGDNSDKIHQYLIS